MSRSGTFLSRSWRVARAALADLLWPPVCAVCPRALPLSEDPGRWTADFCPQCLATVELLPPEICPVCGRPFYHSSGHLCGDCLTAPPPFKTARAAAVYRGAVARSIGLLKYHGDLAQVRPLARLAAEIPPPEGAAACDVIVPLPLSPRRLAARGFNQSLVLARAVFSDRRNLIAPHLLNRPAEAEAPQVALSRKQRRAAIRGSFQAPAPGRLRGAGVLLFDDVVTTGATAAEAAGTILAAGAREVHLVTVARTVPDIWR